MSGPEPTDTSRWSARVTRTALLTAVLVTAVAPPAIGQDVEVTPANGGAFVVLDSSGAPARFRVDESGAVTIPGLPTTILEDAPVCYDAATGLLGNCPASVLEGPPGPPGPAGPQGLPLGFYTKTLDFAFSNGSTGNTVSCDAGDTAVSGGIQTADLNTTTVASSYPSPAPPATPTAWVTQVRSSAGSDVDHTWYVVCADFTP